MASSSLSLTLSNHHTDRHYDALVRDHVVERARRLVRTVRTKGLRAVRASTDPLVAIGMELDDRGRVIKNSLGVLDLSWEAARHPEWPLMIREEVGHIRAEVREAHGVELCNLIWAGMGGSAEDKAMYEALGLFRGGVRVFILDSTDPAKLQAILKELTRGGTPLKRALCQTLVVGMAMGMTSYEPVVNLEKLHRLYQQHKIASAANFLYMTLPGSLLDRFGSRSGYRRVELQPDSDNTTAGRHSGPLTRGSLYPLALNGVDLEAWMSAAVLAEDEIQAALRMAAFLHGNGVEGRDKVCLLLPREWRGAGIWTKQDFEESLGKSEEIGIKIFPSDDVRVAPRRPVRNEAQDHVFWAVCVNGCAGPEGWKELRNEGYPVAALELRHPMALPKYMQWVHYVVFGLGCLRRMNFVTQPSVEIYKTIANRLHRQAVSAGRIEQTQGWRALTGSRYRARAPGGITLYYDSLVLARQLEPRDLGHPKADAAEVLARALRHLQGAGKIEYAELTFYGDTRYRPEGRRLRATLDEAASGFAQTLGICTDVYEGPAMNHSYHEMIIGHGRCFSAVLLSEAQVSLPGIGYSSDYHRAQWLATKLALERYRRPVVALTIPDVRAKSQRALRGFFQKVTRRLARP